MVHRRISVLRKGNVEPLYATAPAVSSPSSTLLVEAHWMARGQTCTREFTSHVLTYFPEGASVRHASEGHETKDIDIPSGGVVVSLRHRMESVEWTAPANQLSVQIDDAALASASEIVFGSGCVELLPSPCLLDARLAGLFEALNAERVECYPSGRLFVDGLEQSLASYLVRHATGRTPYIHVRGGLAAGTARRLADYMQENVSGQVSVNELADLAGLSPSHLARAFRVTFNMTPHEYLLGFRIDLAKALLRRDDASILDVAQRSGFKTQQHFSRVFRQRVGVSPGRFRRED